MQEQGFGEVTGDLVDVPGSYTGNDYSGMFTRHAPQNFVGADAEAINALFDEPSRPVDVTGLSRPGC